MNTVTDLEREKGMPEPRRELDVQALDVALRATVTDYDNLPLQRMAQAEHVANPDWVLEVGRLMLLLSVLVVCLVCALYLVGTFLFWLFM